MINFPQKNNARVALTLQYLGRAYAGYQKQKDLPSIQEEVEKALYTILREKTCIHAAGRTDTGVHAIGQVIHFVLSEKNIRHAEDLNRFIYSLNSILPNDISITYGAKVSPMFHARFSCLTREYVYRIANHKFKPALYQNYYWTHKPIHIEAIEEAASHLIGEHDFASFTKAHYKNAGQSTVRRMDEICIENQNHLFFFIIVVQAFYIICYGSSQALCWT